MIVLDTHAWLWWVSAPEKLSARVQEELDRAELVGVPAVGCWEVAMLVVRGRIELDREVETWVNQALSHPRVTLLDLTSSVAVRAALLEREGFEGDRADRMIYATARIRGARLVTRDAALRAFDPRLTLW